VNDEFIQNSRKHGTTPKASAAKGLPMALHQNVKIPAERIKPADLKEVINYTIKICKS
jgi:hypothetical protein